MPRHQPPGCEHDVRVQERPDPDLQDGVVAHAGVGWLQAKVTILLYGDTHDQYLLQGNLTGLSRAGTQRNHPVTKQQQHTQTRYCS